MIAPNRPIPTTALNAYLNRLQKFSEENVVSSNESFNFNRGSHGTTASEKDQFGYPTILYKADYLVSSSYYINDIIRVLTASTVTVGINTFDSPEGTYICVKPVPPIGHVWDGPVDPENQDLADTLIRDPNVCYNPIIPEPQNSTSRYWEKIGGGGGGVNYSTYNINLQYAKDDIVRYTGSIRSFYSASVLEWLYPGTWIAIKDTPASGSAAHTSSFWMPCWPEPTGSMVRYWELISFYPTITNVCIEGLTKNYIFNSQEYEPSGSISQSLLLASY